LSITTVFDREINGLQWLLKSTKMILKCSVKIKLTIPTHYDNAILDREGSEMRQIWTYDTSRFALE